MSSAISSSSKATTAVVRLKDVARVELAGLDYGVNSYLDKTAAVGLGIFQLPGSNAIDTAKKIKETMAELSKSFPPGVQYTIVYNPTDFIQQSVDAVVQHDLRSHCPRRASSSSCFCRRGARRSFRSSPFQFRSSAHSS